MPHSSWGGPGLSRTVRVPVAGIPLNVNPELEVIFNELVRRLSEVRARHGRSPLSSSGGYIKRRISGSSKWSNHSWGLAADFNAGTNPYSYILRYDFPREETQRIADELGFTWGINWRKKDPMHFEYSGSRADAAALTRRLLDAQAPAPKPAPVRPAPTPPVSRDWTRILAGLAHLGFNQDDRVTRVEAFQTAAGIQVDGDPGPETDRYMGIVGAQGRYPGHSVPSNQYNEATKRFQQRLKDRTWTIGVDGYHGDQTSKVFSRFQSGQKGLAVDGKGGPQMWTAIWARPVT